MTETILDRFAAHLARGWACTRVIDVKQDGDPNPAALRESVIVYNGADQDDPGPVLERLRGWLDYAPVALVAAPGDDAAALESRLKMAGLRVEFAGLVMRDPGGVRDLALAVLANNQRPPLDPAPPDFRVTAIVRAYNEVDIVVPALRRLIDQGIGVYVIDNWSTDGTFEQVQALVGQGVTGLERYPAEGPSKNFDHKRLLTRIEAISRTLDADWIIHHDMDEVRESPWPGISYRDALYHVDRCGFNAVNHAIIDFFPVDDGFAPGTDFAAYFTHYELGQRPGHFQRHIKTWKHTGQPVLLYPSGGHWVEFPGQRIYPYYFLIKHYSLRSAAQAVVKIRDRRTRVPRLARLIGWHRKYDRYDPDDAQLFADLCAHTRRTCAPFDPDTFYTRFLVERLAGIVPMLPPRGVGRYVPGPVKSVLRMVRRVLTRFL